MKYNLLVQITYSKCMTRNPLGTDLVKISTHHLVPCLKEAYFWLDRTYDPECHMFYFPQFQSRPTILKSERSLRVALEIPYYSGLLPFLKFKFITFIQVFKFHSKSVALLDPCLWLLIKLLHLFPRVVGRWRLEKNKIRTKGKNDYPPRPNAELRTANC